MSLDFIYAWNFAFAESRGKYHKIETRHNFNRRFDISRSLSSLEENNFLHPCGAFARGRNDAGLRADKWSSGKIRGNRGERRDGDLICDDDAAGACMYIYVIFTTCTAVWITYSDLRDRCRTTVVLVTSRNSFPYYGRGLRRNIVSAKLGKVEQKNFNVCQRDTDVWNKKEENVTFIWKYMCINIQWLS